MDDSTINPYAVTSVDGGPSTTSLTTLKDSFDPEVVGTPGMFIGTVGLTTAAGAAFGAVMILIMGAATLITSGRSGLGNGFYIYAPLAIPIAFFVGGVLAAVVGSVVAVAVLAVTTGLRYPNGRWSLSEMRVTHGTTGAIAGWFSAFAITEFEQSGTLLGIVPAIFGGIFNAIVGERKVRRALRRQAELDAATDSTQQFPLGEADRVPTLGRDPDS